MLRFNMAYMSDINCKYIVDIAKDIIDLSVYGKAQNQSYNRLANFTDKFGYRLAGTENLENAIGKYHTVDSYYHQCVVKLIFHIYYMTS